MVDMKDCPICGLTEAYVKERRLLKCEIMRIIYRCKWCGTTFVDKEDSLKATKNWKIEWYINGMLEGIEKRNVLKDKEITASIMKAELIRKFGSGVYTPQVSSIYRKMVWLANGNSLSH